MMYLNLRPPHHILTLVVLLRLTFPSHQVDVGVLFPHSAHRPYQIWTNVPPGRCCTPTPSAFAHAELPSSRDGYAISATIAHLQPLDIGFVYAEQFSPGVSRYRPGVVTHPGCTTRPWQSRHGPGSYIITDDDATPPTEFHWIVGVSYIRLPQSLPAEGDGRESLWLSAQGISRLSLGGGKWLPDGVSIPSWRKRSLKERGAEEQTMKGRRILDRYTGAVEWRSPHMYKYPDVIEVAGRNYTDEWRGDLVYRDFEGRVLNLTTFEPV